MPYTIPTGMGLVIVGVHNTATAFEDSIRIGIDLTNADTLTQAEFDTIADTFRDGLKVVWDSGWRVGPVTMNFRNALGLVQLSNGTLEAGTATAADYAPPAVSIVVTKRTGFVGKGNRGRFYLPGVIESEVDEHGALSVTYQTDLQTAMNDLLTNVVALGTVDALMLLHDEDSPVLPARNILSLDVQPIVGTQRPRQRR